jgi:hypothetical protein
VQFFEKKIGVNLPQVSKLTVNREVTLEFQRIIGLLEAPATVGYAVPAEKAGRWTMDSLFAAYRKEFGEDIKEPEKAGNCLSKSFT